MIEQIKNLFSNIDISMLRLPVLSGVITFVNHKFVQYLSDFHSFPVSYTVKTNEFDIVIDRRVNTPLNIFFIGTKLNKSLFNLNISVTDFANLDISIFVLDDSKSKLYGNINFTLHNSSNVKTKILYINKFASKYDINLSTHHIESNSNSDVNVKGVVYDNSDVKFDMKIIVDKFLQSITSSELHKVLKLSSSAVIRSVPAIVCATEGSVINHGFALSGFDNNQLSFLYSRGIKKQDVEILLKDAFIS